MDIEDFLNKHRVDIAISENVLSLLVKDEKEHKIVKVNGEKLLDHIDVIPSECGDLIYIDDARKAIAMVREEIAPRKK